MKVSREQLYMEAAASGFRLEVLEKVFHLLTLKGVNATPLIGLSLINRLELLPALFEEVIVPRAGMRK